MVVDKNKTYFFELGYENRMEISEFDVLDASKWSIFLEKETMVPFNPSSGQLLRVNLLWKGLISTLIFVAQHSYGSEQTVGALSIKEQLQLVNSSFNPIKGILDNCREIILQALAKALIVFYKACGEDSNG